MRAGNRSPSRERLSVGGSLNTKLLFIGGLSLEVLIVNSSAGLVDLRWWKKSMAALPLSTSSKCAIGCLAHRSVPPKSQRHFYRTSASTWFGSHSARLTSQDT